MVSQLENLRLREELKKLQGQTNSEIAEGGTKKKRAPAADVSSKERDIALLGRKYSLMVGPWILPSALNNLTGAPTNPSNPESRFAKRQTWKEDTIAELYEYIPVGLHGIMNHSYFTSVVSSLVFTRTYVLLILCRFVIIYKILALMQFLPSVQKQVLFSTSSRSFLSLATIVHPRKISRLY